MFIIISKRDSDKQKNVFKIHENMKKINIIICTVVALMPLLSKAQNKMESTFELRYNQTSKLYEAHLLVGGTLNEGGLDNFLGPSGFCIVVPASVADQPIACASHNPVSANWADKTPAYSIATYDGNKDYHKFVTYGQSFIPPLTAGADVLLFTFSLPQDVCPSSVRMFGNNNPSPSPTPDVNPMDLTFDNSFQTLSGETFKTATVNVPLHPVAPVIYQNGAALYTSSTSTIQWYNNNVMIPGVTTTTYTPTVSGNYYIVTTDAYWCTSDTSNTISMVITNIDETEDLSGIETYPNPVVDELVITNNHFKKPIDFEIYNAIGEVVYKGVLKHKTKVDTKGYAAGAYLLKLNNGKKIESREFIKEY